MFSGVRIAYKTPIRKALSVLCAVDSSAVVAQIRGQIRSFSWPTGDRKILDGFEVLISLLRRIRS